MSAHQDRLLRASDGDREATVALLRRHHADGRLDADELEERVTRCFAARTQGELVELVADLPSEDAAGPAGAPRLGRRLVWRPGLLFALLAVVVAASALTGWHGIWLVWPLAWFTLGPWGRRWGRRRWTRW
jgi:hypothetical protein